MKPRWLIPLLLSVSLSGESPIVSQIRVTAMSGDLPHARQTLKQYRDAMHETPDYIEGLSWLARGELRIRQYQQAETTAIEVRNMVLARMGAARLDANPSLATALGASIEVQSLAAAATGRRDQAVAFLRQEVARWRQTSIQQRIQKNLNLLSLEGKPAPPLEVAAGLTSRKPQPLANHLGHPVLLFFWAHWCVDCKAQLGIIQQLQKKYGSRGLEVIAPTQHYGYIAGGEDAPRDVETRYMQAVYTRFYSELGPVEVPVSEENFNSYGVSSTPTLVLLDSTGLVRLYNPGNATYDRLAATLEPLLAKK